MLRTFASRRPYNLTHALGLVLARLVLALVVGVILALFAGYIGLLVWVMVAG